MSLRMNISDSSGQEESCSYRSDSTKTSLMRTRCGDHIAS